MKHLSSLCLLVVCAMLCACQSRTPSSAPGDALAKPPVHATSSAMVKPGQTPASATSVVEASLHHVHKGMAYADFRMALLADGWRPTVDLKCKAHVVGADYKELCAKGSDSCNACDELPELSGCSGDAVCMMHFQDAPTHRQLEVSTYGDIGDRNVRGANSQLGVTGWTVSPLVSR